MDKEGCLLSVVRSSMPQDIGAEGIVLLETRNQFVLVTKQNRLRKVNKRGHLFQLLGVEGRKRNADATDFGRDSASDHLWGCDASFQVWGVFDLVLMCLLNTCCLALLL